MVMRFDPGDDAGFEAARDALVAQFVGWLQQRRTAEVDEPSSDAAMLLDWKFNYGDGQLTSWTLLHLDEYLLEWYPRKVMIPQDLAQRTPANTSLFMVFLADQGLMSRRSSSLASIEKHLRQIEAPFLRAYNDTSRHGLGKSMLVGMESLGLGFDPGDPSSLERMMDTFNALSFEERGRMMGIEPAPQSPWEPLVNGIDLPPAHRLSQADLDAAAAATDVMQRFVAISAFCQPGRKLTQAGRLTVADGTALARLLHSDEEALASDRKIRSSDELGAMSLWVEWARLGGVVRTLKGALVATASWKKLSPTHQHTKAVDVLLEVGPLGLLHARGWHNRDLDALIDDGSIELLVALYALGGQGMPYVELLDMCRSVARSELSRGPYLTEQMLDVQVGRALRAFWAVLESAGIVEAREVDPVLVLGRLGAPGLVPADALRVLVRSIGAEPSPNVGLAMTELGRAVMPARLSDGGYDIPAVGELVEGPLDAILDKISSWHRVRVEEEFLLWSARRGIDVIMAELRRIVVGTQEPQTRMACVDLAGLLDDDAERAVRSLLPTRARGHVQGWLAQHGLLTESDQEDMSTFEAGLEMLSLHCTGTPDDDGVLRPLLAQLFEMLPPQEMMNVLWRVPEPWAGDLLAAIDRVVPDKAIAKQARKALHQHRSL